MSIIAAAGNVGQSLLLARLRPDLVAKAGLVQSLIWTLGAFSCWLLSGGPVVFAVFFLISQIAQSCVVLALSRDLLRAPRRALMLRLAKPIIASSVTVGVGALAWAAMQRLPIVFVTSTAGAQEGAFLGVAGRILDVLFIFPTVAAATLLPVLANRAGSAKQGDVQRRSLALMTALGAVLAFGASIGGGAAAVIMFGSDYVASAATVAVYSLVVLPFAVDCYWGTQLIAANRGSAMAWTGIVSALVSITLAIVLTPTWGAVGGAFAVLLAQSLRALCLWIAASDLRQRATRWDQGVSAILVVVAVGAVSFITDISHVLAVTPVLGILVAGISSVVFALIIMVLLQIRWREFLAVFGRGA
ncbi:O-antigen/teichoic acid export membrane protein [Microbacterium dextranolyticum]|nr:O-antigen/teichoic acid export membrane protein [Microbacterium dextranolyticum]